MLQPLIVMLFLQDFYQCSFLRYHNLLTTPIGKRIEIDWKAPCTYSVNSTSTRHANKFVKTVDRCSKVRFLWSSAGINGGEKEITIRYTTCYNL